MTPPAPRLPPACSEPARTCASCQRAASPSARPASTSGACRRCRFRQRHQRRARFQALQLRQLRPHNQPAGPARRRVDLPRGTHRARRPRLRPVRVGVVRRRRLDRSRPAEPGGGGECGDGPRQALSSLADPPQGVGAAQTACTRRPSRQRPRAKSSGDARTGNRIAQAGRITHKGPVRAKRGYRRSRTVEVGDAPGPFRLPMGARGRARAHELFAEEKIVDQYEQLYRDCLTRRHESV